MYTTVFVYCTYCTPIYCTKTDAAPVSEDLRIDNCCIKTYIIDKGFVLKVTEIYKRGFESINYLADYIEQRRYLASSVMYNARCFFSLFFLFCENTLYFLFKYIIQSI
jgi:hypothetical protein